jgi:hypothetical protein
MYSTSLPSLIQHIIMQCSRGDSAPISVGLIIPDRRAGSSRFQCKSQKSQVRRQHGVYHFCLLPATQQATSWTSISTSRQTQYKLNSTGRPVYRSHHGFGPLRNLKSIPKIVDFGLSTTLSQDDDHYCAPEVILGCGWTMSADVWNMVFWYLCSQALTCTVLWLICGCGCEWQLWYLIQGKDLFRQVYDIHGQYARCEGTNGLNG